MPTLVPKFDRRKGSLLPASSVNRTITEKLTDQVSVKDFGLSESNSAAQNKTAIEAAITSLALTGGEIFIPKGNYNLSPFTISSAYVALRGENQGAVKFNFATVGANTNAVSVNSDNVTISNIVFIGPTLNSFIGGENCIQTNGTFSNNRVGFTIFNCEVYNFGSYGIDIEFTNNTRIYDNYIHNVGYGGVFFRSGITAWIENNRVSDIGPGSASNMYGISLSHTDTPPPTDKLVSSHFSYAINVTGNEIQNIAWEGIDTHGAYEVNVSDNRIYNTKYGIAVASSSGSANNYAGSQNIIHGNIVDARKKDGTNGDFMHQGYGININGYTNANIQNQKQVIVSNNIIYGKGVINNNNSACIQAEGVYNALISNNIINMWRGVGIVLSNQTTALVNGNIFGPCNSTFEADQYKLCIFWRIGPGFLNLVGNVHLPNDGLKARKGFVSDVATSILADSSRLVLSTSGNNFSACVENPFIWSGDSISSDAGASYTHPPLSEQNKNVDLTHINSVSLFILLRATEPVIIEEINNNGIPGQIVSFRNISTHPITFKRKYAALQNDQDQTLATEKDTIVLVSGTRDTDWTQISPVINNG
jgi:parallel beta-helix repeat protein